MTGMRCTLVSNVRLLVQVSCWTLTLQLFPLLAENGNGDLLSFAIRYGGMALVTCTATEGSSPRQPFQSFMSAPFRNSFDRWSIRSCHLSNSILQKPHLDLMYCASDFHESIAEVILTSCISRKCCRK